MMNRIKNSKLYRFLINILRIPYIFIFLRGHISRKGWLSTDINGNYVPWISYPATDFLDNLDTSDYSIFEFGSGSSTLWWAAKAKKVTSVELEQDWHAHLQSKLPNNAEVNYCGNIEKYPRYIHNFDETFDIIVIDGAERYRSAKQSIEKLSENGMIILDNTDWYPKTAKMLRDNEFVQIDFYGFSPINSFPECTSLFLKDMSILKNRRLNEKKVIGGNIIKGGTLDDRE